jgi:hypothetical protein
VETDASCEFDCIITFGETQPQNRFFSRPGKPDAYRRKIELLNPIPMERKSGRLFCLYRLRL